MIVYNGAAGGLGRYLRDVLRRRELPGYAVRARLEDRQGLRVELDRLDPGQDILFVHLAARVSVPACESDPAGAYRINVTLARDTVAELIDWTRRRRIDLRVVYVSTGHVYAAPSDEVPLTEASPTGPRSEYARTKLAAEEALRSLAASEGIPLIVARVFGLIAPSQPPSYVLPGLIRRARERQNTGIPGLDYVRDYLDSRDVCEDLVLLGSAPWSGMSPIVNVCSGVPVTIRQLLDMALREVDPARADALSASATAAPGRPDDIRWIVGDFRRFVELTGEAPQRIPLERTVHEAVAGVDVAASPADAP